jgi:hypothetical protein
MPLDRRQWAPEGGVPSRTACRRVETVAPPPRTRERLDMDALALSATLISEAGQCDAEKPSRGCTGPVRLVGATNLIDRCTARSARSTPRTPNWTGSRTSTVEPPGGGVPVVQLRAQSRRLECPDVRPPGRRQRGSGFGRGPSVHLRNPDRDLLRRRARHGLRQRSLCRARRDRPVSARPACLVAPVGIPTATGCSGNRCVWDCYDYLAHVV